jgi:cell division protein FtsW (lipid II flippase)
MANQFLRGFRRYRWKEFRLFILPFIILLLGMFQLPLARLAHDNPGSALTLTAKDFPTIHDLVPMLGLVGVLLGVNLLFSFFFPRADQILLPLVGLLSGIGVLMATRLGPSIGDDGLGTKQLTWVILGLFVCIATLFGLRNMNWLRRYFFPWIALGIFLVGITLINTLRVHNLDSPTHDQLNIGPLNFQPSELLKICIVIYFAGLLSIFREDREFEKGKLIGRWRIPPIRILIPMLIMLGLALLLFLVVRELGLALLIYSVFLSMLYLGSGRSLYVILGLGFFAVLGFIGYSLFSYVRARFAVVGFDIVDWGYWTNPSCKVQSVPCTDFAQNQGLQIVQGILALSSGGILGTGLGLGHPGFVPVIQSDMVLSALGEELGLAGLFAIIGLYLLLIYRGFRIAIEATDPFNQLLAAGLTSIFAIQTLIISAGNLKLLPLTGIPLPFLSYGGSSIIANYIIVGILLRISHNTALEREGLV